MKHDPFIAGALFDFLGHLTTRDSSLTLSSAHSPSTVLDLLTKWAKKRGLELDEAMVQSWNKGAREGMEKTASKAHIAAIAAVPIGVYGGLWLGLGGKKRAAIRAEMRDPRLKENLKNMLFYGENKSVCIMGIVVSYR